MIRCSRFVLYVIGKEESNGEHAMAFQPVPDAVEIVIAYQGNTKNMNTVLAASLPGGYNTANLIALATAVDATVGSDWLPIQTLDVNYISTTVRGLAVENDLEETIDLNAGPGLLLSPALPGNATISIKKQSPFTGRSARGRTYWIGLTQGVLQANENLIGIVHVGLIVAAMEAMRMAISGTTFEAAIVSRFSGGVPRPSGITFQWVTSVANNFNVDSQRRRLID